MYKEFSRSVIGVLAGCVLFAGVTSILGAKEGSVNAASYYVVSFDAGTGGSIDGDTFQFVNAGESCTAVTALPDAGFVFAGWTGDYTGTDNPLTIKNVAQDMEISATFSAKPAGYWNVTFLTGDGGTLTGVTVQTVKSGENCAAVTAVPDAGFVFAGWTGDYTGADNPLIVKNVKKDMSITANFSDSSQATVISAKMGSSHTETVKTDKEFGDYVTAKDAYSFSMKIQLPKDFDLSTVDAATAVHVWLGDSYEFDTTMAGAVKSKRTDPTKGGAATFTTTESTDSGKTVTIETVTVSWNKNKILDVKVVGKPLPDSGSNIVDLTSQADGKQSNLELVCEVDFGDTTALCTITYGGKKSTKTSKDNSVVSWSVSGKGGAGKPR